MKQQTSTDDGDGSPIFRVHNLQILRCHLQIFDLFCVFTIFLVDNAHVTIEIPQHFQFIQGSEF